MNKVIIYLQPTNIGYNISTFEIINASHLLFLQPMIIWQPITLQLFYTICSVLLQVFYIIIVLYF
jgi:hypothetical protein